MIPGQPLLFHPPTDLGYGTLETPFAATVAYTNPNGTVNLSVIDHAGNQFAQCDVRVLTGGEPEPTDGTAYAYDVSGYVPNEELPVPPPAEPVVADAEGNPTTAKAATKPA